jgi:hypothetical protein
LLYVADINIVHLLFELTAANEEVIEKVTEQKIKYTTQLIRRTDMFQLTDFSDEILLLILKKLTKIEVLYSLRDVNQQFDMITNDRIFTEYLTLMTNSSNEMNNTPDHSIVDRFCTQILPKIHTKIKWLNLESVSMRRFLFAAEYPNLYGLTLFKIEREIDLCLFDGESKEVI